MTHNDVRPNNNNICHASSNKEDIEACILPDLLTDLYNSNYINSNLDELRNQSMLLFEHINVDLSCAKRLEMQTIEQSKSVLWHQHRAGRITASVFYAAAKTDPMYPSLKLMNRILPCFRDNLRVPAIMWGVEHENDARRQAVLVLSTQHDNLTVTKAGLVINEHYPYLAASPDGWIECSCCGKNVLEIKCPFSIRDMQPDAAPFLVKQPDGSIVWDRGHEYFYQVQG